MRRLLAIVLWVSFAAHAAEPVQSLRLYTLDCGHAETPDMGFLSDTGEYDGKPGKVAVPCFVVRHPKGTLLWDTGLDESIAAAKNGVEQPGIRMTMSATLTAQLRAIGLSPADITYVAFSHLHFDHTSNANLFAQSTWILNKAELAWALSSPTPLAVQPDSFSAYKSAQTKMIDGDLDVFEDGSVRILKTPGHTPGHQVLQLRLRNSGTVILSGDLYHQRESRAKRLVPRFNVERADTLASIERIERIAKNTKARFVVQHDERDFASLPRLPNYLD